MVQEEVDEDDIAAVVGSWTGIPVSRLLEGETEKLIHMEERLHQRVVGQHAAVEAVATRSAAPALGSRTPDRPIGSFVFLGPTGVGKTEWPEPSPSSCSTTSARWSGRHVRVPGAPHRLTPGRRAPGYVGYDEAAS